jgi:hypothetical protein
MEDSDFYFYWSERKIKETKNTDKHQAEYAARLTLGRLSSSTNVLLL